MASAWPPLRTTLLSQVFQPPAAMRMRRTPEGAARVTGAGPLSTPSTLTCAPCGTAVTVSLPHAGCRRTCRSRRAQADSALPRGHAEDTGREARGDAVDTHRRHDACGVDLQLPG